MKLSKDGKYLIVSCKWGWCSHWIEIATGKIWGGTGPIVCPCDHLKGWRSEYVEGQAKPAAPVKARGRYGSRVQRSRRRHTLPKDYMKVFGSMLPARCNYREE